ncbi:MAG TPA: TIGR02281 family clan AA aspartic protease [Alphaproteobacteria bacterium]
MKLRLAVAVGVILTLIVGLIVYLNARYPGSLGDRNSQIDLVSRLTILSLVVASLIVALRSARLGAVVRAFLVWIGLGLALVVGYSYREEIAPAISRVSGALFPAEPRAIAPGTVALRASSRRHFRVVAEVNGQRVQFLVDTGASDVALTRSDARRIGIDPDRLTYNLPYRTANGTSFGAAVRIDRIAIGDIVVEDVAGHVAAGELGQSLLGMSFLGRLSGFEVRGDEMILRQ